MWIPFVPSKRDRSIEVARVVLAAWRRSLPPEARALLRNQLRATSSVATSSSLGGKTVGFSVRQHRADPFPHQDVVHAARVQAEAIAVGPVKITCDIYCANGYLDELIFDRPTFDIRHVRTRTLQVHCYAALMHPATEQLGPAPEPGAIPGIAEVGTPDRVLPPAPSARQAAFARAWSHLVPDDFLQLCDWTDGLEFGQWEVLCTRSYLVALTQETNLLILATGPDARFLCVRPPLGRQTGVELFEHDYAVPVGCWQSFMEALRFVTRFVQPGL